MKQSNVSLAVSTAIGLLLLMLPALVIADDRPEATSNSDEVGAVPLPPEQVRPLELRQEPPPQEPQPDKPGDPPRWPLRQRRQTEPGQQIGFLTGPATGDPLDIALDYIRRNQKALGLSDADLAEMVVKGRYVTQHNQVTHIYLRQLSGGIEVFNGDINVNVSGDGRVINLGNRFVSNLNAAVNVKSPTFSAIDAVNQAAQHLGLTVTVPLSPKKVIGGPANEVILNDGGVSRDDIPVKLMYLPQKRGEARLVWNLVLRLKNSQNWWNMNVDAVTGEVLSQNDWIATDTYRVFASPLENPDDGSRTLETNPADPIASPFGWHDTNGVAGAEFTDTRGNNVFAQEDGDFDDTGGFRPDGGPGLDFDFALDLTQDPSNYQEAAITNLFYWNNILHDIHYHYGFDEPSGNFQQYNYGHGGQGGDPVQADAQDGSGTDNANFGTPPDGFDPRMQMFVWTFTTPFRDSDLDNSIIAHEYGHGVSTRLTGGAYNSNCLFGAQSGGMGEGWSDFWALALTAKATDGRNDSYPLGNYVLGQPPTGPGIRNFPYSTDLSVDPQTYVDIATTNWPHGVGEIWAVTLWEMYWNLVDEYGFDPDFYAGSGGNNLALQLVMDGLKLQPCSPTFLDARDAILLADLANSGGANQCSIWEAFAKRGMGVNADDGDDFTLDVTEDFDLPTQCLDELLLTKSADPSPAYVANALTYSLVASNYTSKTLTGVIITDTVPVSTTYVPGSASDGGSESGGIVQWNIGTMVPDTVATHTFQVTVDPNFDATSTTLFFDDLESGGGNWTASGLWHLEADSDPCGNSFSPTTSWYYGQSPGCTYDTGFPNNGQLTMAAPVSLPTSLGTATLNFWSWEETENFQGFDTRRVYVSTDGVNFTQIWDSINNDASWYEVELDLSGYIGQNVWIRFEFDTGDDIANFFTGWYVDDVRIVGQTGLANTAFVTSNEGDSDSVTLNTPVIEAAFLGYAPAKIEEAMPLNQVVSRTVTVSNTGALSLTFSLADRAIPLSCDLLNNANNDFEQGDFTGWTAIDGNGTWLINDGTYPRQIDGETTPPVAGIYSALVDQLGPGTNSLYQDVAIPVNLAGLVTLSWTDQWENHAGLFDDMQEFRVELYGPGGTPFLGEVFSTSLGDPLVSGPTTREVDVTSLVTPYAGQDVRLQFSAETFFFYFNVQIDDVQLCDAGALWASVSPATGSVPPFSQTTVSVVLNSNVVTGTYNAEVVFSGNMANSVTPLPVTMHTAAQTPLPLRTYLPFVIKQ